MPKGIGGLMEELLPRLLFAGLVARRASSRLAMGTVLLGLPGGSEGGDAASGAPGSGRGGGDMGLGGGLVGTGGGLARRIGASMLAAPGDFARSSASPSAS